MKLHAPDVWSWNVRLVLQSGAPYPGDAELSGSILNPRRFRIQPTDDSFTTYKIIDSHLDFPKFNIRGWYSKLLVRAYQRLEHVVFHLASDNEYDVGCLYDGPMPDRLANEEYEIELVRRWTAGLQNSRFQTSEDHVQFLELNGQQVEAGTYPAVQRNSAYTRDPSRKIPKPLVIHVMINGHRACALVDSGSLGDFMSSTLAEQLKLKKKQLTTPLPVQLAVQGSRSKVNFGTTVKFEYQRISCDRYFDIINLSNYDLILGTPLTIRNPLYETETTREFRKG